MRRILPLLVAALAATACGDLDGLLTPADGPGRNVGATSALSASITGPHTIGNQQSCSWTGVASGGVSPYSYRWVPSYGATPGTYFVGGSGPSNVFNGTGYYSASTPQYLTVWLDLEVTDAVGAKATHRRYINLYNYAIGCIS